MKTISIQRDEITDEFDTPEKFSDDIMELLFDGYSVEGESVTGQAISYLQTHIKTKGWRFANWDFENILSQAGFLITTGTNSRNQTCMVVYL